MVVVQNIAILTEDGSKKLDQIYSFDVITEWIKGTLSYNDTFSLKKVLKNVESNDIKSFYTNMHITNRLGKYELIFSSIINYSIKVGFEEGFDVLVEYFGVEALTITDEQGRTPFMMAVISRCYILVSKIAQLSPKTIHLVDIYGNNALHWDLYNYNLYHSYNSYTTEIIKLLLNLEMDLDHKNVAGKTARDLISKSGSNIFQFIPTTNSWMGCLVN